MPIAPGSVGTDLFQRKVATPYSGPPVAPPVTTTLPPPVVTPPPPTPTTGGVVGGGQVTGNTLSPPPTSPARTTGDQIQAGLGGSPSNTGVAARTVAQLNQNMALPGAGMPGYVGGAPKNTGAVVPAGYGQPQTAAQARAASLLGITPKTPVAPKTTVASVSPQARAAAKLGITPQPAKPVAKPLAATVQTAAQARTSALFKR